MNMLLLCGHGSPVLPQHSLGEPEVYAARLHQLLESSSEAWVVWNPLISHLSKEIITQLDQFLDTDQVLPGTHVLSIHPDHYLKNVDSLPQGIPLVWRKTYLLETIQKWPSSPLPSALYLPFAWLPQSSMTTQLLPSFQLEERRTSKRRGYRPLVLLIDPHQLTSIVPIIERTRPWVQPSISLGVSLPTDNSHPEISILMSIYQMHSSLGWAVRSVLAQDYSNFEFLIGDDGSDDGSSQLPILSSDARIQLHVFPTNRGKASVMNDLLSVARGNYILELDGDDWLAPEALTTLAAAMRAVPEAAIATGTCGLWQGTRHLGPLQRGVSPYRGHHTDAHSAVPLVPRMYRADLLRGLGGWPQAPGDFGRVFEDIAVCEALLAEHPEVAVAAETVYHRVLRPASVSQRAGELYPAWRELHAGH
ncbi:hypothetical protein J2Z69_002388 [Paenibacillus shirakamiensis]|uniref:Glycosyltransferase 2-like domain-containing protein n=1 Tax=Paenibacillus shirakamiensis TaxID=1265935 RepID=A0ABS4JHZ8_9BACL|nr:glycosyltransferase [Paenibacillus shirakamiensis]MBP2001345.1 hypothetical protein [Paenibacillus shirakamiensis]